MNFKRDNREYKTTTNKKVYKICHFAHADMCCLACTNRRRRKFYHIFENSHRRSVRNPSWKLVSKNRKQWMKKPIKISKTKWGFSDITW